MKVGRAVIAFGALCVLLIVASGAQSASATGTTAYTCKKGAKGGTTFSTPHCRSTDAAGKYGHVTLANNTTTELSGNNKDHEGKAAPALLVATVFGTTIELQGKALAATGTMENKEEGGEMFASGEGTITFTEVSVVKPANCQVQTDVLPSKEKGEVGVIHTEALKATTKGQGDRVKFEPKEGTTFARFWMTGESCGAKNTTFTVTGSITGVPNGATVELSEADTTAQNTLKLLGAKAGLTGSLTIEGKDPTVEGDAFRPLAATTGEEGESEAENTENEEAEEAETEEAETNGTTAYTCKEGVGVGATFNTSHCRPADASGKYGHFSITNDTTTKVLGDNKDHEGKAQNATLVGVVSGVSLEVKGEAVEVEGSVTNSEEGGEMWASGEGILTFREISVLKPANCQAQTDVLPSKEKGEVGVIHTEPMRATTKGQGDQVKVEPKEGTTFARFWLVGGSCTLAGETFSVTGSVEGTPNGSTLNFTEAETTTQDTLKINGNKAGFSGSLALKGKHPSIEGETYKRLSVTTK